MIKNKLSLREDGITQDYVNSLFDYDSEDIVHDIHDFGTKKSSRGLVGEAVKKVND